MNKKMDKYNKNKNQELIMLVIKFGYVIINTHINERLFVVFTLFFFFKSNLFKTILNLQ